MFKFYFSGRNGQIQHHDSFTVFDDCLVAVVRTNSSNRFQGCLMIPHTLPPCWMTPLICAFFLLVTLCTSTTFTQLDVTIVCNKVTPGLSAHTDCGRHWLVTAETETWPSHEAAQWQTPGSDCHVCSLRDKPSMGQMGHVSRENRDVLEKKKIKESLVPKSPHGFSVHIFLL